MFAVLYGICLFTYIIYTIAHVYEFVRREPVGSRFVVHLIRFIVLVGWFSWYASIFFDPKRLGISSLLPLLFGILLTILGVIFFIASVTGKSGFSEREGIVKTGIYSKLRHPMYYGIILVLIGVPLMSDGFWSLILCIPLVLLVLVWIVLEEISLRRKYGTKYERYKKETWI